MGFSGFDNPYTTISNCNSKVEDDLQLDEIILLITELPKSDRYMIYKSVLYMLPSIMTVKNISSSKSKEYISMITRVNQAECPVGYFLLKLCNPG